MFNNYSIIWIIRIFLQIRIRIRIFLPESRIFGFGFENFLTTNKIRIRIRKISGLRIRFEIRIRSKKRFVTTLTLLSLTSPFCKGRSLAANGLVYALRAWGVTNFRFDLFASFWDIAIFALTRLATGTFRCPREAGWANILRFQNCKTLICVRWCKYRASVMRVTSIVTYFTFVIGKGSTLGI